MLELCIYDEAFDDVTEKFVRLNEVVVQLEHSLAALSKWESRFKKPFLSPGEKSSDEMRYYIECMALENLPGEFLDKLSDIHMKQINDYLANEQTATKLSNPPGSSKKQSQVITAEVIYYMMFAANIPIEFEKRNLNRLLVLVKVCAEFTNPPKKMSQSEIAARQRQLNAERRDKLGTSG